MWVVSLRESVEIEQLGLRESLEIGEGEEKPRPWVGEGQPEDWAGPGERGVSDPQGEGLCPDIKQD